MNKKYISPPVDGDNTAAGHRSRLRRKFIDAGLDSFSQHEIVEFLLFYAIPRKDTKPLAKKMLGSFVDLYALLEAAPEDIMNRCDVSENTAVFFHFISQLARSYMISKWEPKEYVDSPDRAADYARALLTGTSSEVFYLICLNKQKRLICSERVSTGTVDGISINIRQIVELALMHKCSYVILTHNHPGGLISPSYDDVETTKMIKEALSFVEISILDHIIIAGLEYFSFAKKNILGLEY